MPLANRNYDHFGLLQDRILARLTVSDPAVDPIVKDYPNLTTANGQGIPFMTERVGDFANTLTKNLQTTSGLVAVVLLPTSGDVTEQEIITLEETMPVIIQIQENVVTNMRGRDSDLAEKKGTQVPAQMLVLYVKRRLHGFCHGLYDGDPLLTQIKCQKRWFKLLKVANPLLYNVYFDAPIDLGARLPDEFDELLFDDGSVVQYA